MKLARTAGTLGLLALAAIGNPAFAEDTTPLGWYAGASLGRSKATIDDARITNNLLGSGYASTISDSRRDETFKILGGYQMNKNFALEGGYFDLGHFGYTATTTPAGTLTGETKMRGINLDLVGRLPVTDNFSVFGRVGATYGEARDTFRGTGLVIVSNPNPHERAANAKFGVGMEYAFTPSLSARAEIERYRMKDAVGNRGDIDTATIGLVYRFGDVVKPAPVVAPAPEPTQVYVAPPATPPAPAPIPAPAPAPVSHKVSFAADTVFAFDKAVLTPAGKATLNDLVSKIKAMNLEVAVAVGHTDSVGAAGYNQKLSVRRAAAVKAYLVANGIEANRVYIEGKGETQPVADNKTAAGRAKNRRVDVEVIGQTTK